MVNTQAEVLPEEEICDLVDNDCDNAVDNLSDGTLCCDADGDGIITDEITDPNLLLRLRIALGMDITLGAVDAVRHFQFAHVIAGLEEAILAG